MQAMEDLWPWLGVAGLGALHGLHPAGGWVLAAGWGLRTGDRRQALRALGAIALGHAAAIGLVAWLVRGGLSFDRVPLQAAAAMLAGLAVLLHFWRRTPRRVRLPAGHAGMALGSFVLSTASGAGLMLVPALLPLCGPGAAGFAGQGGPLLLALAAVGVHTAAMLLVAGLLASGICRAAMRLSG